MKVTEERRTALREALIYVALIGLIATYITAEIILFNNTQRIYSEYQDTAIELRAFFDSWESAKDEDIDDFADLSIATCETVFIKDGR